LFLRELENNQTNIPDILIIAIDANCKGFNEKQNEINDIIPSALKSFSILAVPDPHIEKWLMIDQKAFKNAIGHSFDLPAEKCEKNRYKNLLIEELQKENFSP
jgi:hypothetical protein